MRFDALSLLSGMDLIIVGLRLELAQPIPHPSLHPASRPLLSREAAIRAAGGAPPS